MAPLRPRIASRQRPRCIRCLLALATMPWLAPAAFALDTHIEIGAAAEHRSNAARVADNEESDTLQILLARLGLRHDGVSVTADVDYDIQHQRYADDTFDDENIANGSAAIDWRLWQDTLSLLVDHTVADTVTNSTRPDTPDNRTRRSVLAVGPRLTARLSPVDRLALTARKVDVSVDDQDEGGASDIATDQNDSERDEASLQWTHQLAETRAVFVGVSYADVSFDNVPLQDYEYNAAFAGLMLESRLVSLALQAGVNKAKRKDSTQDDTDGKTLSATLGTRDTSAPFQASAYYVKAITDSSVGFVGQTALPGDTPGEDENLDIVDIIEREQTGVTTLFYLGSRTTQLMLGASQQKQDYQQQPRDDEIRTVMAELRRQSTPRFSTRLFADRSKQKQLDLDTDFNDTRVGLGAEYNLTDAITLRGEAYRLKRDHSTAELSYDDDVVRLEVTYSFDHSTSTEPR